MTNYKAHPTTDQSQPDRIALAYQLAGVTEPSQTLEIQRLINETETTAAVTDRLAQEALTADDADQFYKTALEQIRDAQAIDAIRVNFTARLAEHRRQTMNDTLARTVADLTPALTRLVKDFTTAAKKLPTLDPLDIGANVDNDTTKEYKAALQALTALSVYASIYRATTPGDLPPELNVLLPIVGLPDANVEYIDRLHHSPLEGQQLTGTYAIREFAREASINLDHALIGAARGDYDGITISLATPATMQTQRATARAAFTTNVTDNENAMRVLR